MSNFCILQLFNNFLKNGLKTCLYFLRIQHFVNDIDNLNYSKGHFQGRKGQVGPFSHDYLYYSVVTKCCPILLHHVASLV